MSEKQKERWSTKKNERKNTAIVLLMKCGWTTYGVAQLFGEKDKRNTKKIWERDQDKYFLPCEKVESKNEIKE